MIGQAIHHTLVVAVLASDTFGTNGNAPSTPFGNLWLGFADALRILCLLSSGAGVWATVLRWRRVDLAKKLLMVAACCLALSAAETEWDKLGDWVGAGGRLYFNFIGTSLFALWGTMRVYQGEPEGELGIAP